MSKQSKKLNVDELLQAVIIEVQAWTKEHCPTQKVLREYAQRWGVSYHVLRKFMTGWGSLPPSVINAMSIDTGIPVDILMTAAEVAAKQNNQEITLVPSSKAGEGTPCQLALMPETEYKNLDFKDNSTFYVRTTQELEIKPKSLVVSSLGVRIIDRDHFVVEFLSLLPAWLSTSLITFRQIEHAKYLNAGDKPVTLKEGQRIGRITVAPQDPVSFHTYRVPRGLAQEVRQL